MFDKNEKYAYVMAYEKETMTYEIFESANPDATPSLVHQASAMPTVSREKIVIGINTDGSSEWTITKQIPKNPFIVKDECLPDNTPKTHVTKISNGQATYYDINGNLLHTEIVSVPSFKTFIDKIKQDGDNPVIDPNRPNKSGDITIEPVNQKTSSYTKIITESDNARDMIGYKVQSIVDNSTGKVFSNTISDIQGMVIFKVTNKYDNNLVFPMPVFSQTESLSKDSQGEYYITKTTESTENIQITNNLD